MGGWSLEIERMNGGVNGGGSERGGGKGGGGDSSTKVKPIEKNNRVYIFMQELLRNKHRRGPPKGELDKNRGKTKGGRERKLKIRPSRALSNTTEKHIVVISKKKKKTMKGRARC